MQVWIIKKIRNFQKQNYHKCIVLYVYSVQMSGINWVFPLFEFRIRIFKKIQNLVFPFRFIPPLNEINKRTRRIVVPSNPIHSSFPCQNSLTFLFGCFCCYQWCQPLSCWFRLISCLLLHNDAMSNSYERAQKIRKSARPRRRKTVQVTVHCIIARVILVDVRCCRCRFLCVLLAAAFVPTRHTRHLQIRITRILVFFFFSGKRSPLQRSWREKVNNGNLGLG